MADLICRWRNGTPKNVVELVNSIPHVKMKIGDFKKAMSDKWNGSFFTSQYQLACQLGLYYESDDGYFYPRFDHDITEREAENYLFHWFPRYYVPNPYVGRDGFNNINCPTYVLKSIFDFVKDNPDTEYSTAYQAVFKETAKNNDDIVRNYINNYSNVLNMSKEGKLVITNFDSNKIFGFMDRYDRKSFFENFSDNINEDLLNVYNNADNETRQNMFYDYLAKTGLKESSCKQYAFTHPKDKSVLEVISNDAKCSSLFEITDILLIDKIYKNVLKLQINKDRNNALSASISNYKKFIDYLETGYYETIAINKDKEDNSQTEVSQIPFSISTIIQYIKETGLLYTDKLIKRFAFSLMAKRFLILSGLAGSGKTQLALAFANALIEDKKQLCVVSVGADWTNREPLLGFPNALQANKYERPESGVLDLLIEANKEENKNKPYFLILDEMNMSYVERYFADFLSVMESGESISLWSGDGDVPQCISLPKNLFIIGTINVDETTYMFSPKVLDRANVIEFKISPNEMGDFLKEMKPVDRNSINGKAAGMGSSFVQLASVTELDKDENAVNALNDFFGELKKVNAEFGYRTATEIFRYIAQAKKNDDTDNKLSEDEIIDSAIVQKLLPKLHGSRKKLEPVLYKLWDLCLPKDKREIVDMVSENVDKANYKESADKILRMYLSANANGFTSFAEA